MRRFTAAVAFVALAVPVAVADEKDDAAKKLNGTYTVLDFIVRGKSDDSKKDAKITFVFKDGTIDIKEGDKKDESAKFTLDPSKKPPHIDITPRNNKVVLGIYEVKEVDKGTELTIAFAKDGGERPKDFKGEGKEEVVIKLFRKK
jgi:uncharacterized protein (TIGR03067 family)